MRAYMSVVATILVAAAPPPARPISGAYRLAKVIPLGQPDRWDYVVYDGQTRRVYVAHGDRLDVIDPGTGALVGSIQGISGGTHGTAVSLSTGQGFTDDGRSGKVIAFDLRTLKATRQIPAEVDADAIAVDRASGHIFVIEGDPAAVTVIDPKTDQPIATIKAGEKLEYGEGDGRGSIYVAGVNTGNLVKINARRNRVVARWPAPGCTSPHGLAVDARTHRIFMGCANSVMVAVDGDSGRVVATLPIGRGNDAVAFDSVRRRVFSSNGRDGTISVFQQTSPDRYVALPPISTTVSARTMSVDSRTGRLFVAGADTGPATTPEGRPTVRPGTLRLMIFEPNR